MARSAASLFTNFKGAKSPRWEEFWRSPGVSQWTELIGDRPSAAHEDVRAPGTASGLTDLGARIDVSRQRRLSTTVVDHHLDRWPIGIVNYRENHQFSRGFRCSLKIGLLLTSRSFAGEA